MSKTISVVVPCYNEGRCIQQNISNLAVYLSQLEGYSYEIVAVNDGSKDNTLQLLKELKIKIPQLRVIDYGCNKGKGYAVKVGMLEAKGDLVFFTDADLSTPVDEIGRSIKIIEKENISILIGSRAMKDSNIKTRQPFYRVIMGKTFSLLANSIVPLGGISDTQCGFKCFTKEAVKNVFPFQTMERFSFDVELLYIAKQKGYTIRELPVTWENDETSTVNPIRDSARMFRDLWVIRKTHKSIKK